MLMIVAQTKTLVTFCLCYALTQKFHLFQMIDSDNLETFCPSKNFTKNSYYESIDDLADFLAQNVSRIAVHLRLNDIKFLSTFLCDKVNKAGDIGDCFFVLMYCMHFFRFVGVAV